MATIHWEWFHDDGYGYITECKLYYNGLKPIGYARFEKRYPDGKLYVLEFEKEGEFDFSFELTDRTWDVLLVGYDLFLKKWGSTVLSFQKQNLNTNEI
tara:strand:- start:645 stop:938 length:294 start_codon:yes stop_codon:yes gene_type:complete